MARRFKTQHQRGLRVGGADQAPAVGKAYAHPVDIDDVTVMQGDTAATPAGPGTGGSRSAVLVSGAATEAAGQVRNLVPPVYADRRRSPLVVEIAAGDNELPPLELTAPNRPGLLKGGPNFLYVIMPVNLQ